MLLLAIALGAVVPFTLWLRGGNAVDKRIWTLIGLLPFLQPAFPQLDLAFISWGTGWPGLVTGLEVTALDVVCVGIYLGLAYPRVRSGYGPILALYLVAVGLSTLQAAEPTAATFYLFQICRVGLLLVIVARAASDATVSARLIDGIALGVLLECAVTIWQRFGLGVVQTAGTFPHQNTLGMVLHFAIFPQVALLLAGHRNWTTIVVPLAGVAVVVLTASRAALLFTCLGLVLIYTLSILRHLTVRKSVLGICGCLLVLAMAPAAIDSFAKRFEQAPINEEEYDERAAFSRAARYILADNPLGIGANHYVHVAKNYGYSEKAGVVNDTGNRNNLVHNAYLLTASETGWLGLIALVLVLAHPLVVAVRAGWSVWPGMPADMLCGLSVGLLMVCLHSSLEYILLSRECEYLFAISAGLIYGMASQVRSRSGVAPAATAEPAGAGLVDTAPAAAR
ncbi:O-antigen ligase family protein [Methylobacterium sp. NEAU 140]|uniref:O-antigen ligase family protein n=1 Tax=Methylobacterium sp. NEAU 140 TaxID=3064945 RepID=UPI002736BDFF|nr:O-antigen ligase family protein [Methylobacterium sp. NEAU 140]MDP4023742.1 O-antigen ligase family protein [Methylobacterium sp. NEAU 140]